MKNFVVILFFLLGIFSVEGQSIRASIDSSEVFVGQPFEYTMIIEGTGNGEIPELKEIDGIDMEYKGSSTSMVSSFGMGKNTSKKTVTYVWIFRAQKTGTLMIPSFDVKVDGKVFRTASGTILVKEPADIEGFYLILETDKETYWEGEPVSLTIKWLFSSSVSNPSFNLPFIQSNQFIIEKQDPASGNDVFKLNINGIEVLATQGAEFYKGDQYSTLFFGLKLIPQSTGPITLEPITLAFDSAKKSNGFRTIYESKVIPSNRIRLNIRALPDEAYVDGRPVILSKGNLELSNDVNPQRGHVGDPLTYRIIVKGAVRPEVVTIPPLRSYPLMAENFSVPEKRSMGKIEGEYVTFLQTIRVKNDSVTFIPSIDIPYFNLETGRMGIAQTEPLFIDVLKTDVVTSANLESTGYSKISNINKRDLISREQGILFNFSPGKLIQNNKMDRFSVLAKPLYWILLFLPLLLFLVFIVIKNQNVFMVRYLKEGTTFRHSYKSIIKNGTIDEDVVRKAIYSYILLFCRSEGKSLTPEEIELILVKNGVEKTIARRIYEMLISFDCVKYAREKKDIDWRNVLDDFYKISVEMNGK